MELKGGASTTEDHVVFEPVAQKQDDDCAIASLAMYLGVPYVTVRGAAGRRRCKGGMTTRAIINTAKKLGHQLELRHEFDMEEDIGIADLLREDESDGHAVVFIRGLVWTPASGQLWCDLQTYCTVHRFTVLGLITRKRRVS